MEYFHIKNKISFTLRHISKIVRKSWVGVNAIPLHQQGGEFTITCRKLSTLCSDDAGEVHLTFALICNDVNCRSQIPGEIFFLSLGIKPAL